MKDDYVITELPLDFARELQNLCALAAPEGSAAESHPVVKILSVASYKRFESFASSAREARLLGDIEKSWHFFAKASYEVGFADGLRGARYAASQPSPEEAPRENGRKGGNQKRLNQEEKRDSAAKLFASSAPKGGFKSIMEFENELRAAARRVSLSASDPSIERLKAHPAVAPLWKALRA